jgi:hypothetical protein
MTDTKHLSHLYDPETSKQAAEMFSRTGKRKKHSLIVLDAIQKEQWRTGPELMAPTGLDEYAVRRRLSDLKAQGRIIQGSVRACSVKGTKMVTWGLPGQMTLI